MPSELWESIKGDWQVLNPKPYPEGLSDLEKKQFLEMRIDDLKFRYDAYRGWSEATITVAIGILGIEMAIATAIYANPERAASLGKYAVTLVQYSIVLPPLLITLFIFQSRMETAIRRNYTALSKMRTRV